MSLESVNTNTGAMVALQSLESTQSQLATTQKQISTGWPDSSDEGAAYTIAQSLRSTVGTFLNTIGSSVDADLAKESAQLTALQIRQQLGTQALSLADQAPQSLLSLFR
jgi:flagellin-like hook-associated protein FlgL